MTAQAPAKHVKWNAYVRIICVRFFTRPFVLPSIMATFPATATVVADVTVPCCFKAFNTACKTMIRDLIDMRPASSDLRMLLATYKIAKMFNRRAPQQVFNDVVGKYDTHMMNRNIAPFIASSGVGKGSGVVAFDDIQRVTRDMWPGMAVYDRDRVWAHLAIIVALHRRCCDCRDP